MQSRALLPDLQIAGSAHWPLPSSCFTLFLTIWEGYHWWRKYQFFEVDIINSREAFQYTDYVLYGVLDQRVQINGKTIIDSFFTGLSRFLAPMYSATLWQGTGNKLHCYRGECAYSSKARRGHVCRSSAVFRKPTRGQRRRTSVLLPAQEQSINLLIFEGRLLWLRSSRFQHYLTVLGEDALSVFPSVAGNNKKIHIFCFTVIKYV